MRPLPIPHLHDWRNMEVCLINFNKGKDDEGCLKFCNILKWSATTEGLFKKYSTLWQHKCESPITAGCPLSFETGGTMGYNCCFFLNFVPLHIESPYNFGGRKPSAEGKWACWTVLKIFFFFFYKILYTLTGGPLNCEALGFSLLSL